MINLSSVKGLVALGKTLVVAHRSELLLGASITSTIGAVVLAAKGGYEARGKVDEAEGRTKEPERVLTVQEKANLTWHCYWPAAAAGLTAVGSTTGLHIVHVKEKKQLAAAALMTIDEIKRDAQKVIDEKVGPLDKDQQEAMLDKKGGKKAEVVVQNGDGEVEELFLVRDPSSGRDIWSNKARIEEAIVEVGNMINGSDSASLNNFYDKAGYVRLRDGDLVGWGGVLPSIDWNDENGIPIAGVRDDGRPYRGFRFRPAPEAGYDDPHR